MALVRSASDPQGTGHLHWARIAIPKPFGSGNYVTGTSFDSCPEQLPLSTTCKGTQSWQQCQQVPSAQAPGQLWARSNNRPLPQRKPLLGTLPPWGGRLGSGAHARRGCCRAASEASEPTAVPGEGSLLLWCKGTRRAVTPLPNPVRCRLEASLPREGPGNPFAGQTQRSPPGAAAPQRLPWQNQGGGSQELVPAVPGDQAPAGVFLMLGPP